MNKEKYNYNHPPYLTHCGTEQLMTERLILRRAETDDYEAAYRNWTGDDRVTKYMGWDTHENSYTTKGIIENWYYCYEKDNVYRWVIVPKEYGEPIGMINITDIDEYNMSGEVGFCIGSHFWGNGYCTEALKRVLQFGLENVGFIRISGRCDVENVQSGKVMLKSGMSFEGVLKKQSYTRFGTFADINIYAITR